MTLTDYMNKAYAYMKGKLPDVPEYTIMEIAAHLANVAAVALNDEVHKVRKEFVDEIKRRERKKYPATPASLGSGSVDGVLKCYTCEHRNGHTECTACNEKNGFKYYKAMEGGGAANA